METLESVAADDGEDRLRSVLVQAHVPVGQALKISRALKEVVAARAKSEAIDEANRDLTAAAVQLEAGVAEYTTMQNKCWEADGRKRRGGMKRNLSGCVADMQQTSTTGG